MSDVFISYSRKNSEFARRITEKLTLLGKDSWVDWEGIATSAPNWWAEIKQGIEAANSFVFIMSPDSMASVVCNLEMDYAFELNKRIIPVVYAEVASKDAFASIADYQLDAAMQERLEGKNPVVIASDNWKRMSHINWLFFRQEDDFDATFAELVKAIETDDQYVKAHTRYLTRAKEWQQENQRSDLLLFGTEIDRALLWLEKAQSYSAKAEENPSAKVQIVNPIPSKLQLDYIEQSRRAARRRRWLVRSAQVSIAVLIAVLAVGGILSGLIVSETQQQVVAANATLTPIPLTIDAQNTAVAAAEDARATAAAAQSNAEGTSTQLPPTLTQAAVIVANAREEQQIALDSAEASLELSEGRPSQALARMNAVVARYPQNPLAYVARGLIHAGMGNYELAIADYTEAIRLNPQDGDSYNNRGNAYYQLGEYEPAIADYTEAIRLDPQYAEAYYNRGLAYYQLGEHEQAIADFSEAIRLSPQRAEAYNNRGTVYLDLGEYDLAIADSSEAIRLNPQYAEAYTARGIAYYFRATSGSSNDRLGDLEHALADWQQAEALGFRFPPIVGEWIEATEAELAAVG